MTPNPLEQILSLESVFETAFQTMLMEVVGPDVFLSREKRRAVSPYVVVKMVMATVDDNHQQPLTGQRWIYNVWDTNLKVTIVTNRSGNGAQHTPLIGQVRTLFQRRSFKPAFAKTGAAQTHELVDMRERDSQDSEDNENDLDITEMNWFTKIAIHPGSFPTGT